MASPRSIGNSEYLKKKIPRNPKYHYVRSKINTGCSLIKYLERMEELKKNYRYRKGELFKRLKVSTFAQLVIQVASISDMNNVEMDEDQDDNMSLLLDAEEERMNNSPEGTTEPVIDEDSDTEFGASPKSTLQSLISGIGELDVESYGQRQRNAAMSSPRISDQPYSDCPYLLLDVRDKEEYERCHIISAYSYPIATLARTMDPYTKEVLEYKNAQGKIIILYDEDERMASVAATTMFERGFENVFMLSGGLRVIAQRFPEGMTTGTIPVQCLLLPIGSRSLTRVPFGQDFHPADRKCRFTFQDIRKILQHQEEMLVPSASNSQVTITSKSNSLSKSSSRSQEAPSVAGSDSSMALNNRPWR